MGVCLSLFLCLCVSVKFFSNKNFRNPNLFFFCIFHWKFCFYNHHPFTISEAIFVCIRFSCVFVYYKVFVFCFWANTFSLFVIDVKINSSTKFKKNSSYLWMLWWWINYLSWNEASFCLFVSVLIQKNFYFLLSITCVCFPKMFVLFICSCISDIPKA